MQLAPVLPPNGISLPRVSGLLGIAERSVLDARDRYARAGELASRIDLESPWPVLLWKLNRALSPLTDAYGAANFGIGTARSIGFADTVPQWSAANQAMQAWESILPGTYVFYDRIFAAVEQRDRPALQALMPEATRLLSTNHTLLTSIATRVHDLRAALQP